MSESELRSALLQKGSASSMEDQLCFLRQLIESEHRRAKRLARWTIVAWTTWGGCIALMLILPRMLARTSAPEKPSLPNHPLLDAVLQLVSIILIAGAITLPILGLVLLVLHFMANRSVVSRNAFTALTSITGKN